MKKVFLNCMLLLCALIVGSGNLWAGSYTITFGNNASSATAIASTTNATTVISNGTSYVDTKPFTIGSGKVYYGDNKTSIRMGQSGNSSSITIALSTTGQVKASSIVVNCKKFNDSNSGTLNVNSIGAQSVPSSANNLTFSFASATDITSIVLSATKATYVYSITVNYSTGGGGGGSTSPAAVTFDFATNIFDLPTSSTTTDDDYTYNDTDNGYSYTISLHATTGYYYQSTNKYLMLGQNGSTLTFPAFPFNVSKIKIYGRSGASSKVTQNIYVGSTAVSTGTTNATDDHEYEINSSYQAAGTVYKFQVTNGYNTQITKIEIFGYAAIKMNAYGWMTYNHDYPLDLSSLPSGLTAYQIEAGNVDEGNNIVTLSAIESAVKKNTGILLKGTANTDYEIPLYSVGDDISSTNKLVAVTANSTPVALEDGFDKYVLCVKNSEAVLAKIEETSATLSKGQAYLKLASPSTPAPAIIRLEQDDNNATDIQSLESSDKAVKIIRGGQIFFLRNGITYDALGRVVR